jgi:hypothetical protein
MIAALGTLPFLATLWLLLVLGARVLEESGAKIAAALKGKSLQRPSAGISPVRARVWLPAAAPSRASVQWRAAA